MVICTSYFANLRKIPSNFFPIAICAAPPAWYKGERYSKLAPIGLLQDYLNGTLTAEKYEVKYIEKILSKLIPDEVVKELLEKSGGKDIVLLCFEVPDDVCHRHWAATWLTQGGYEVREYFVKSTITFEQISLF